MCEPHWVLVPAALRSSLAATCDADGGTSPEHEAYLTAAKAEIAHKQSRRQPRKSRPPEKPVQLALF
jgi:hypothetical protein